MLLSIHESDGEVTLTFDGYKQITFTGYALPTSKSPLNRDILFVYDSASVGFRALHEIQKNGGNIRDYQEMILVMDGTTDKQKCELILAYKIENKLRTFLNEHITI
jgi:hypothetical protein